MREKGGLCRVFILWADSTLRWNRLLRILGLVV